MTQFLPHIEHGKRKAGTPFTGAPVLYHGEKIRFVVHFRKKTVCGKTVMVFLHNLNQSAAESRFARPNQENAKRNREA